MSLTSGSSDTKNMTGGWFNWVWKKNAFKSALTQINNQIRCPVVTKSNVDLPFSFCLFKTGGWRSCDSSSLQFPRNNYILMLSLGTDVAIAVYNIHATIN